MDQEKKTLLLAGEDLSYQQKMVDFFHQYQYATYAAVNLQKAQDLFFSKNHQVDIVILEGRKEMEDVIRWIRSYSDIPMIILEDSINEERHLEYMELGADHCMNKTWNMKILKAYVDNLYKRRRFYYKKESIHGKLRIDRGAQKVYIDNDDLSLTPKEYAVLDYFFQNRNVVLTREAILNAVWGYDYQGDIRTVDTVIKQLRKKMTGECAYIHSIYGIGYRFEER